MSEHETTSETDSTVQVDPDPEEGNHLSFSVSAFIDDTLQITDVHVVDEDDSCEPEELHSARNLSPVGVQSASSQSAKSLQPFLVGVGGDLEVETKRSVYEINDGVGLEVKNNSETAMPSSTGGSFVEANISVSRSDEFFEVREERDKLSTDKFNLRCLSTSGTDHEIDLSEEKEISATTESTSIHAIHSAGDVPYDAVHETSVDADQLDETRSSFKLHNLPENESFHNSKRELECQEKTESTLTIEHMKLHEDTIESSEPSSYMPNVIEYVQHSLNNSKEILNDSRSENVPHSSSKNEKAVKSDVFDETLCLSELHDLSKNESLDHSKVEMKFHEISDPACESLTNESKQGDIIEFADLSPDLQNLVEDGPVALNESKHTLNVKQSEMLCNENVPKSSSINEKSVHSDPLDETLCLSELHDLSKNESLDRSKVEMKCQEISDTACESHTNESKQDSQQGDIIEFADLSPDLPNVVEDGPVALNESKHTLNVKQSEMLCNENVPKSSSINEKSVHSGPLDETLCLSELHDLSKNESLDHSKVEMECHEIRDSACESLTNESKQGDIIEFADLSPDLPNVVEDGPVALNESKHTLNVSQPEMLCNENVPKSSSINEKSVHSDPLDETLCLSELHDLSKNESLDLSKVEMKCQEISDPACESLTNESKQDSQQGDIIEFADLSPDLPNVVEDGPVALNESKHTLNVRQSEMLCNENVPKSSSINEKSVHSDPLDETLCLSELHDLSKNESLDHSKVEMECHEIRDSACESLTNESKQGGIVEFADLSPDHPNLVEDGPVILNESKHTINVSQSEMLCNENVPKSSSINEKSVHSDPLDENLCLSELHDLSKNEFLDHSKVEMKCQEISDPACESLTNESKQDSQQGDIIEFADLSPDLPNLVEDGPVALNESKHTLNVKQSEMLCNENVPKSSSINEKSVHSDPLDKTLCLSELHDLSKNELLDRSKVEIKCQEISDTACESLTNESKQDSQQGDIIEFADLSPDLPNVVEDGPVALNESKKILNVCKTEILCNETLRKSSHIIYKIHEQSVCTDLLENLPKLPNLSKNESLDISNLKLECQEKIYLIKNEHEHNADASDPSSDLPIKIEENHVPCSFYESAGIPVNASQSQLCDVDEINETYLGTDHLEENYCSSQSHDVSNDGSFAHKVIGVSACESLAVDTKESDASLIESASNSSSGMNVSDSSKNSLIQDMSITPLDDAASCQVLEYSLLDLSAQSISNSNRLPDNKNINSFTAITDQKPGDAMYVPTSDSNENSNTTCDSGTHQSFMEITFANSNPILLDQSLYCIKSSTSSSECTLEENSGNTPSNYMCAEIDKTISEASNDSRKVMQKSISDHIINQHLSLAIPDSSSPSLQRSNRNSLENSSDDSRLQCEQQTEQTLLMKWPVHYHSELEMLQSQNQIIKNELESKSAAYSKLEADNLNVQNDLKEALEKCEDLNKKVNHLEESLKQERINNNTISDLMHTNEQLLVEMDVLKNTERLYKELKENEDEMVKQIKSTTLEEVTSLKDKISVLVKELSSANNKANDLQLGNERRNKMNSNFEETIDRLNKNILETKKELSDLCIENKQLQNSLKLEKQANNDLENKTISLEENIAVLKSQNEAFWKGIAQRSLNQEEILAIQEKNFKLLENLALHKNEVDGLKLQCEVFTKELESKNNTISDMKIYKKKWKTSLRNLNVKLNELETENEERKQENEHLKLELESERVSLEEELRSLSEFISSLTLEKGSLIEKIVGDEISIQELTKLNHEQSFNIKLIEGEKSSLAYDISKLETQVESLCNTNSLLSTELDSSKNQLNDMSSLKANNYQLNEVINTLERNINSYEEENKNNADGLRSFGETLVSVMMSQDTEYFKSLTILEETKQQVSELAQKVDRLDGLLEIEKDKVKQLSDINTNLSNELEREKENFSREIELESTVNELNNYIISLNEELMSEIFKFDAITYEKLDMETMLKTFSDQISYLKDCEHKLNKENEDLQFNLNLAMSETQRLVDEKDELLESARISEENVSSLRSEKEKVMLENAGLNSSLENCTFKINDLEKHCLENNNLKNTMINEIRSLTSNSDSTSYESSSINEVFVKLMSVFLHKEQEVIFELQNGYEEKIKSLQRSIDLQNSEDKNQTLTLKQELCEQQECLNQYQHDIALLEENLHGVQNDLTVKIEQIQKMEDCLLQAQNEKGSISDKITEVKNIHSKTIAEFEEKLCILKDDIIKKDAIISEMSNNENNLKESVMIANKSLDEKSKEIYDMQVKIELLRNEITSKDVEISDLLSKENDLKQAEFSVKISLEEKSVEMNYLQDQIERLTTALENNKNTIHKHLSDLARKTEMCSSLETQLNVLNEQLKAHHILYDEDILQLKEQIDAKEVIIANLIESNSKLNDDIQTITEKAQGFIEKEEKEVKQDKLIKELEETIQRGQQHYNLLKDVIKNRTTEIEGLLKDLKREKDLNSKLVSKNDAIVAQNYGLQKEVFDLKDKIVVVENKLQSLLSSTSILFPQEVSDEFKMDNTNSVLKSLIEESNSLGAQCKNANGTIKKLEVNIRNALKRELDLKKQIASISVALKTTKDAKTEMEQQMCTLFSNSVLPPTDLIIKVKEIIDENHVLKSEGKGDSEEMVQENKNLNEECEIMNKHIKELEETLGTVLDRENELKRVNAELKSRLEQSNCYPQERLHEIFTLFPEAPSSLNSVVELIRNALVENSSLKEGLAEAKEDYASLDLECESMFKAYQEKETLLNEVWGREEALKTKEREAREEIKRLNSELEGLKTGSSSARNETPAGSKCGCDVLLAGLRSEVTALQLQIQTDSFPLRNTITELEQSLEMAKQRINELRGEVRRYQSQAQQDVTAQGLRTECLRCRDTQVTIEQKDKDIVILKSLCKARKAKITELEQAAGGKSAASRALRPPLKENLHSSSNSGSF